PETFFDYLPGEALFFWCDRKQTEAIVDSFVAEITRHYASASEERRVVSAPQDLYVGLDGFDGLPVPHQQVFFESFAVERRDTRLIKFNSRANDDIRQEMIACASQSGALGTLVERLEQWQANGIRTCIVCHTPSQCRRLDEMLQEYGLETSAAHERSFNEAVSTAGDGRIELLIGQLSRGFRYEDGLLVLITEEEIFGEKKRRRAAPRMKVGTAISDFSDLKEGDYVVHRDNGIGVYLGLETLDAGGLRADYLKLEYLGNDKLYLPVDRINLINKYETAEDSRPRIDKLGGTAWARVKKKVRESVEKIARDLLELYSSRKVYQGHAFAPPDRYYREFEASFPFEETPDQLA
ncbi:MAG: transcription-repair coupling factor, partial [Deltaproteobacteria bacterium]|nr:transcription-repair coupling factor [Deltaproteobacteria bacterium]